MKGIICYFSTTGNTKLACDHINSKVSNVTFDYYDIKSSDEPNFSDYELIGFATYTDYFEPGRLMTQFMQTLKGNNKAAFVFNTYGQISGNTLATMAKGVKASGFKLIEAFSLHVPENYPPLIKNGVTNEKFPTINDLEDFEKFMDSLNTKVELMSNGQIVSEKEVKSSIFISILKKILAGFIMDKMGTKKVHKDQCTSCGLCSKVCPYGVIKMVEGYPEFNEDKCRSCYSCFNKCPTKSIYTKKLDGVGHYAKPHMNLINKLK